MFVEKIILPSPAEEREYLMSGRNTVGMPTRYDGNVPFGIFSEKALHSVDFENITFIAGSSNSDKELLLRIIVSKLGQIAMPWGMSDRCLSDYLDLCMIKHERYKTVKDIPFELITLEESMAFLKTQHSDRSIKRIRSLSEFYEERIKPEYLYFIENPEAMMSLREIEELAMLISDCAKSSGNQFIITTNSPVLLGIKNALIYDLDNSTVVGETWCHSRLAAKHVQAYLDIKSAHKRRKYTRKNI